ncbi:hypothetical protein B0T22DRAFT_440238 [Podospora appendiculata]|uniref:Uncharacterized protein n=1 Tax=Podospora appendiculata TaxID=314037 RepID=A0AAE0XAN1_9PEZI|nr:hypothetical protein B0T22DRAFT_440238 [Podospora appendiculata]
MAYAPMQQAMPAHEVIDLTGPDRTPMADVYGIPQDSNCHREMFEMWGDSNYPFEAVSPRDPSSVVETRSPSPEEHRFSLPDVNFQEYINESRRREEEEQSMIRKEIDDKGLFPTDPGRFSSPKTEEGSEKWVKQRIQFRCIETVADGVPPGPRWNCYSTSSTGDGLKHPCTIRSARHVGPARDIWPKDKYSKPAYARAVQRKLETMLATDPDN